jgi:C4-dicarboxylate-specific signal transduction histidine kinase
MDKIEFMAETIHSFRNFFKPDRTKISFPVMQTIREVNDQLLPQLKVNNIELHIDENEIQIYGSPNEFKQIILNLLVNAHDALIEKKIENPTIQCSIEKGKRAITLQICDNAGGILPEHLEAIFSPYFSTKTSETGRGLGLYLSKLIMEEHFGGAISVVNTDEGACFRLSFLALT